MKKQSINLTFFLAFVLVLGLVSTVTAVSHASGGVSRRSHANLKRIVKKRAPPVTPSNAGTSNAGASNANADGDPLGPLVGVGSDPQNNGQGVVNGSSTSLSASSTSSTASTSSDSSSSTSSSTSQTSSSSTSSTTSSTTSSSSSSSTQGFTALPVTTSGPSTTVQSTVTRTSTEDASQTSSASNSSALTTKGKTALLTVLIVVAASVGGIAIIWTIFRKWKLGRSSKFDQRLQPIDWQPTNEDDGGIVQHRHATSDTSSFHSGFGQDNSARGYGATSEHGHDNGLAIADHDFTAGPSHLAPVGGYADLSRGPSPQPYMQENLSRGPSLTRPTYDVGVPLHHQTGYGAQDAYNYNGSRY